MKTMLVHDNQIYFNFTYFLLRKNGLGTNNQFSFKQILSTNTYNGHVDILETKTNKKH